MVQFRAQSKDHSRNFSTLSIFFKCKNDVYFWIGNTCTWWEIQKCTQWKECSLPTDNSQSPCFRLKRRSLFLMFYFKLWRMFSGKTFTTFLLDFVRHSKTQRVATSNRSQNFRHLRKHPVLVRKLLCLFRLVDTLNQLDVLALYRDNCIYMDKMKWESGSYTESWVLKKLSFAPTMCLACTMSNQ